MVICLLLDIFYAILLLIISPMVLYRMVVLKRYRTGWLQRFGFVPCRGGDRLCIWIHGVSMGEINAIGTLLGQLEEALPEYEIIISSTTDTGMTRAKKLYGNTYKVFFYPLDFSWSVKRAFNRLRPSLCILMELEVWHNFTALAKRRGIPVVVANGRISSGKGFPRYRKIAALARPMFSRLALALVQDETYAQRFRFLGVPAERVQVVGSLKYDTADLADKAPGTDELADQLLLNSNRPIWVAGSTGPGEEAMILQSFAQLRQKKSLEDLLLVIVPRKPERFDEVARMAESAEWPMIRYSNIKSNRQKPTGTESVIIGDTMGDLRKFYSLADVIFVGRSLVPMGGSDMIEAAALAKPVIVGPFTENFSEPVKLLEADNAIEVVTNAEQLTKVVANLLLDKNTANELAQRSRKVIINHKGATQRTVNAILKLLKDR